jgi:hypothetical protein
MESRVEDWGTMRECHCGLHKEGIKERSYDVRGVRYAAPGEGRPLKTDFSKLTEQQKNVLQHENDFWKDKPWAE